MEYPGDKSLDHLVGSERLGLDTFLRTAIAMAEAIAAVHRHHIIHKDIKPENFLCDDAGHVTLIEFGAATRLTLEDRRSTHVGRLEGTLAYMSPEQTGRMNRSVDRRTDLYSLGVALCELGTGVLPFATDDPLELLHSHIARSPLPLHMIRSDWPRIVSEIVMRLLAKNAEDRHQDISGFRADLVRCQELLAQTGTIPAFTLGEQDLSDELRIPQRLYGREKELATLLATFQRACQGAAGLLLVSGYSGVGKSVLVGELHKQMATGARFATGKFDSIGRRIPYAPIIQACGEMLRSILAEPPTVVAQWRQKILQAVGNNGRVVTDIIPELSLVLGGGRPSGESLAPLPRTVVDVVLQAREKVVLTQASEPSRFSSDPYLAAHKPQSLLCMPMIRQGELIGILYLENRLVADVFTSDQIELLEMLSTQAAISIENARLYEEMEERVKDRTRKLEESLRTIQDGQAKLVEAERRAAVAHLESELAIAQRIQTSILPRRLSVAGMEIAATMQTATEVGGDYYDLLPTEDGGFWLGIGHVSGHGLHAGLVMLMLQSGLASFMRSDASVDPAQLLCSLNRSIYDNVHCRLQRDDYVTLSLFRFFPDGRFLVAGAHEDVLIWRARSRQCEQIRTQGTWIGAVERIEFATRSHEGYLGDGDVIVLYTDGVIEARRPDREQFGVKRVIEIVALAHAEPAAEICRSVLEATQAWEPHQQDDRSLVVLRRTR